MNWFQRAAQWLRSLERQVAGIRWSDGRKGEQRVLSNQQSSPPAIETSDDVWAGRSLHMEFHSPTGMDDDFADFYHIVPPDPIAERRKRAEELLRRLHNG